MGDLNNSQSHMISPTRQIQVIYRMRGSDKLFQKVINLPDAIETSGVNFDADQAFADRVHHAFRAAMTLDEDAANRSWNAANRDAWPLETRGDQRHEIVAVFGLGARPKALITVVGR